MKLVSSVLLTGALGMPALGCDLCAIYSANQARGEIGKGPFAGVAEQFTHFGTVQVDGVKIDDPTRQYMDSSVSQLFGGYNFNERLGLQFNLPVIYRSFKRPSESGVEHGTESGIGDVSLVGHFQAYRRETKHFTFGWNVLGGVKFPTGSARRLNEELGEETEGSGIHGHDLTLGSGSYDGIVGTGIFTRWKRSFFSAATQYAIRSTGAIDYHFANDLTWLGGPGIFLLLRDKYTLALQALVSGEAKNRDTFRGEKADDTGVVAVYLGPQITFTLGENLSAEAGVDLPIKIWNTALQTVPDYRVRAGFTWHF
jgi:hypothetical protein